MIGAEVRSALVEHAEAERPNEACGLILLREGVAERYVPGENEDASPYRFRLKLADPLTFYLEDEGYEIAIFHSHLSSPPRPSRTDVENIGQWKGRPYVILNAETEEIRAWRITDDGTEPLALSER